MIEDRILFRIVDGKTETACIQIRWIDKPANQELYGWHLLGIASAQGDYYTCNGYTPLSKERLAEIHAATCRYGSGNLWTGTTGTLCGYIRELLREVEQLRLAQSDLGNAE